MLKNDSKPEKIGSNPGKVYDLLIQRRIAGFEQDL